MKIKSLGVVDVAVRWIEAYLSGQVSRVYVWGELSGLISMRSGIPQGSVICSVFLTFVNDLLGALEALSLIFADNAKMVTRRTQSINLHSFLTAAWDWSQKWGLPMELRLYNHSSLR